MKNKILQFILFMVVFVACWNLCDLIYSAVITRSEYSFTPGRCILEPVFFGVVIYLLQFAFGMFKEKNKNKQ